MTIAHETPAPTAEKAHGLTHYLTLGAANVAALLATMEHAADATEGVVPEDIEKAWAAECAILASDLAAGAATVEALDVHEEQIAEKGRALSARRAVLGKARETLRAKLLEVVEARGGKVTAGDYKLASQKSPASLDLTADEATICDQWPQDAGLYSMVVKVDSAAVKAAIKGGATIPGARLVENKTHLRIRM